MHGMKLFIHSQTSTVVPSGVLECDSMYLSKRINIVANLTIQIACLHNVLLNNRQYTEPIW